MLINAVKEQQAQIAAQQQHLARLTTVNGGAVAVWASSGMTFAAGQVPINRESYRQLYSSIIYFCSGNLKPIYVPELIPINPSNVVLNSGMVNRLYTEETKITPSTIVHAKI